jgi:ABC-2 type transport system ATP-binding protein
MSLTTTGNRYAQPASSPDHTPLAAAPAGSVPAEAVQLELSGVSYCYPDGHQAIDQIDLALGSGVLGLLGPNGAGKSTLMRLLATLRRPTSGQIRWRGIDTARSPDHLRRELGYLPQDFGVHTALTAREFLLYIAAIKGLPRAAAKRRAQDCLDAVGLQAVADHRLAGFSGGMRQRVGIAQALLNQPALLIVDEPTVGLDPAERLSFRHLLADLATERLVILSTHIVSDLEASATELAVLSSGRLCFRGTPEALTRQAVGRVWEWTAALAASPQSSGQCRISAVRRCADGLRIRAVAAQAPVAWAEPVTPTLEDGYIGLLAGKEAEGG